MPLLMEVKYLVAPVVVAASSSRFSEIFLGVVADLAASLARSVIADDLLLLDLLVIILIVIVFADYFLVLSGDWVLCCSLLVSKERNESSGEDGNDEQDYS
jgi:hypothetical protein